jgi:hypothetical protein
MKVTGPKTKLTAKAVSSMLMEMFTLVLGLTIKPMEAESIAI